jgi:type II secretory pathway predicted ATPase ExeA
MLHRHGAHAEAAARISWCISEHALGVITGEVGAGKTVALRAALASLDASRHALIYLGNPSVGVRGINHAIVAALGGVPKTHHALYRFRTRHTGCELRFGRVSRLGQDRCSCLLACSI